MRTYELTYLTIQEEGHDAPSVAPILAKHEAKIAMVHPWGGRRQLAYPIHKQDQAFYTTVKFEAEPAAVVEIEKSLKLQGDVMRSLITLFAPGLFDRPERGERMSTAERLSRKPSTTPEPVEETPAEEPTAPEAVTPVTTDEPAETPKTAAKPKKAPSRAKKKLLDEEIDKLLHEDITA